MGTHKKEKVCQTCGGYFPKYEQLLATCSECETTCVHVYCMRKLKQEVPQDWVCESCLSGNDVILLKSGGKEDNIVTSPDHGHRDLVTFLGWQVHSKKQKPVETGKVKFIPHEEVIKLSLGAIETRSPSKGTRSLKLYAHGPHSKGIRLSP